MQNLEKESDLVFVGHLWIVVQGNGWQKMEARTLFRLLVFAFCV